MKQRLLFVLGVLAALTLSGCAFYFLVKSIVLRTSLGAQIGPTRLSGLSDVSTEGAADGDVLTYSGTGGTFNLSTYEELSKTISGVWDFTATTTLATTTLDGRLGINVTAPTSSLDVDGDFRADGVVTRVGTLTNFDFKVTRATTTIFTPAASLRADEKFIPTSMVVRGRAIDTPGNNATVTVGNNTDVNDLYNFGLNVTGIAANGKYDFTEFSAPTDFEIFTSSSQPINIVVTSADTGTEFKVDVDLYGYIFRD